MTMNIATLDRLAQLQDVERAVIDLLFADRTLETCSRERLAVLLEFIHEARSEALASVHSEAANVVTLR